MIKYFTDKNKLNEYYKRFANYLENNSKEVKPKYDFWKKQVSFKCPCCGNKYDDGFEDEWNYHRDKTKGDALWYMQKCFSLHLYAIIRLRGDVCHIKLLIEIIGEELAGMVLEGLAQHNMLVALTLKEFAKQLKDSTHNKACANDGGKDGN